MYIIYLSKGKQTYVYLIILYCKYMLHKNALLKKGILEEETRGEFLLPYII